MTTEFPPWNTTSQSEAILPNVTSSSTSNLTLEEYNDQIALTLLPAMIYVGVLMIVGVFGNGVVFYVFARKMPSGTQNFLVLCLAVFDLLSCAIAMPTEIVDMRQFYLFESEIACKMLRFVNVFTALSSIFTLLVIALDRYKNVLRPFQRQMSLRSAHRSIILVLISSFVFSWPAFALYGIHRVDVGIPGDMGCDCSTSDAMRDTVYPLIYNAVQFLGFILITVALLVVYVRILRETRRHYRYLKDTSDFYYVTGSVARSEATPGVALISDSRINLHEYFLRDVERYRNCGRVFGGVDNAAFSGEEYEDTVSLECERPQGGRSPKLVKQLTSPVLVRRLKAGRNNAKYFISPHSDNEMIEDRLKAESRWNKSVSTPDFDNLIHTAQPSPRDVRSEGKPTPLQSRRFLKRRVSVKSCGQRSTSNSILEKDLQLISNNLSESDNEIIRQAMRQQKRQLSRGLSESNIACHSVQLLARGSLQADVVCPPSGDILESESQLSHSESNSEINRNITTIVLSSSSRSSPIAMETEQSHLADAVRGPSRNISESENRFSHSDSKVEINQNIATIVLSSGSRSSPDQSHQADAVRPPSRNISKSESQLSHSDSNSEINRNIATIVLSSSSRSSPIAMETDQSRRGLGEVSSSQCSPLSHSAPATPRSFNRPSSHSKLTISGASSLTLLEDLKSKIDGHLLPGPTTTAASVDTPAFFLPQNDEGIDMSFEMDDDVTEGGRLTLAMCPRCQSHFLQKEDPQNVTVTRINHGTAFSGVNSSPNVSEQGSPIISKHKPENSEQIKSGTATLLQTDSPTQSWVEGGLETQGYSLHQFEQQPYSFTGKDCIIEHSVDLESKYTPGSNEVSTNDSICLLSESVRSHDPIKIKAADGTSEIRYTDQLFCSCQKPDSKKFVTNINVTVIKTGQENAILQGDTLQQNSAQSQQNQKPPLVRTISENQTVLDKVILSSMDTANSFTSNDEDTVSSSSTSAMCDTATGAPGTTRKWPLVRAKSESLSFYKMVLENSMKASEQKSSTDMSVSNLQVNENNSCTQISDVSISSLCDEMDSVGEKCGLCNLSKDKTESDVHSQCASVQDGKSYSPSRARTKTSPESRTRRQSLSSGGGAQQTTPRAACRYLKSNYDWMTHPSGTSVRPDSAPRPSSATSIAVCVTTVFILSFLPHLCLMLARILEPDFEDNLTGSHLVLFNIFVRSYLANSALNPFVYGWLNQQFRHHCCSHCSCCKKIMPK